MTDLPKATTPEDWLEEPKKRPETLNVISILTIVGSGLAIASQFFGYFNAQRSYDEIVQAQDKINQAPDFVKKLVGPDPVGLARKTLENRTPMLILTVVAAALCIYGALQMRKLKKIGFPIYVIGELLPLVAYYIFIGPMGAFTLIFSLLVAGVFIILYGTQLKYFS